jgi:hypothetical protein
LLNLLLQLVREGRTVIVAARSANKASEVFTEAGLVEGYQVPADSSSSSSSKGGILITEAGVDVTNPATLTKQLFEGVTQVGVGVGVGVGVCGCVCGGGGCVGGGRLARGMPCCCCNGSGAPVPLAC